MWNYWEEDENRWKELPGEQTSSDFSQLAQLQVPGGRGRPKTSITILVLFSPVGDCECPVLRVGYEAGWTFWVLLACPVHVPRGRAGTVSSGYPVWQLRLRSGTVSCSSRHKAVSFLWQGRIALLCSYCWQPWMLPCRAAGVKKKGFMSCPGQVSQGQTPKIAHTLVTLVPHPCALPSTSQPGLISWASQVFSGTGLWLQPWGKGSLNITIPRLFGRGFAWCFKLSIFTIKTNIDQATEKHLLFICAWDDSSVEKIKTAAGLTAAKNVSGLRISYFSW